MAKIKTRLGDIHFTQKYLYLGIKQIDRDVALLNLKEVCKILNTRNIHWGPIFGTLLGIVREKNFIEWDEDIDLYILEEEEDDFKDCLYEITQSGFELIRYERRGLYSIMKNGEYIDFYVLRRLSPELRHGGGVEFIFEKYLQDTIYVDFRGVQLRIPREYDEHLTFYYGDWRTPVKWANFEMSTWQKFKVKSICFIKNHLPDCIYFSLLTKYHQKDLDKFKKKCRDKGVIIPDEVKMQYDSRR